MHSQPSVASLESRSYVKPAKMFSCIWAGSTDRQEVTELSKRKLVDSTELTLVLKDPANATRQLLTRWGDIPLLLMLDIDWKRGPLVIIGLSDYMMWPLLPPGTLLQLEPKARTIIDGNWSEFERPVYLIEHGGKFYCCHAQQKGEVVVLMPHADSRWTEIKRIPLKDAKVRGQLIPIFRPLATRGSAAGRPGKGYGRPEKISHG